MDIPRTLLLLPLGQMLIVICLVAPRLGPERRAIALVYGSCTVTGVISTLVWLLS